MKSYTPPKDLLAGRVILVTGAGRGIGRAVSLALAEHGASVVLLGRTAAALEQVYDAIEGRGLPRAAILPLDLATVAPSQCEEAAMLIEKELGRLDGLLHNAAELGALAPIEHYDPPLWYRVMQVNVHAPFLLTRACLPLLKKSPDASVVFTSADVGRRGRAYWGAYGTACFAIEGMMQVLAEELSANTPIRVNSLDPGAVRTTLRARAYPGEASDKLPLPEEIVAPYLYLLGPDSKGTTGQALSLHNFL
jgi:NAD(P)-dependent dehydrogenase (short-subunit alcohol dehydrogenase family)